MKKMAPFMAGRIVGSLPPMHTSQARAAHGIDGQRKRHPSHR